MGVLMNKKKIKILIRSNKLEYANIKYIPIIRYLNNKNSYLSSEDMINEGFAKWMYL